MSLRQEEHGFRVLKLAIVPTEISMWTDLGMQSRYIPDSSLTAFPKTSRPEPRFGRLHAEGLARNEFSFINYFTAKMCKL